MTNGGKQTPDKEVLGSVLAPTFAMYRQNNLSHLKQLQVEQIT